MRVLANTIARFEAADDKTIGKLIITLAVLGIALSPSYGLASSITGVTNSFIQTITCLCHGKGFDYNFEFQKQGNEIACQNSDLDECECTIDGTDVPIRIPHVNWLDQDEQDVDLVCESKHIKVKRSIDDKDVEKEVIKTNILSRSVNGVGSIIGGAGNLVGGGVEQVGSAIGGAISGGFHLVGKVTKGITGFAGDTVKSVGGVFEGKKTIRPKRSVESTEIAVIEAPLTETATDKPLPSADIAEAATFMQEVAQLMFRVSAVLNENDRVSDAKDVLYKEYELQEYRDIIDSILGDIEDKDLIRETTAVEVISHIKEQPKIVQRSGWERVKHMRDQLAQAENVFAFTNSLIKDSTLGEPEKKFAEYLKQGLMKESSCGAFNGDTKVTTWSTAKDIEKILKDRRDLCGQEPGVDELIAAFNLVPSGKTRSKRSIEGAKKMLKRHKKKKPIKAKKAKKAKEEHEEVEEEEHIEEELDEDVAEEVHECRCDPDTCKPLL